MSRLGVVVPVKGRDYKTRLAGVLEAGERAVLSRLLLADLLRTLTRAGLIGRTFVVSSSEGMLGLAKRSGARTVREGKDSGVNAAVKLAVRSVKGFDEFMILPADLPLLTPADIMKAFSLRGAGMDVVLSPSASFNGTNLLVIPRSSGLRLSYDRDSFWNHLRSAAEKGLRVGVYTSRGVLLDVDTESDAKEAARVGRRAKSVSFLRRRLAAG